MCKWQSKVHSVCNSFAEWAAFDEAHQKTLFSSSHWVYCAPSALPHTQPLNIILDQSCHFSIIFSSKNSINITYILLLVFISPPLIHCKVCKGKEFSVLLTVVFPVLRTVAFNKWSTSACRRNMLSISYTQFLPSAQLKPPRPAVGRELGQFLHSSCSIFSPSLQASPR